MTRSLRILSLEDDAHAVELIEAALESDGVECELVHVETDSSILRRQRAFIFCRSGSNRVNKASRRVTNKNTLRHRKNAVVLG